MDRVQVLLAASSTVVATVGARGDGFVAEVERRSDVEVWELTRDNRDAMPDRVVSWLGRRTTLQRRM